MRKSRFGVVLVGTLLVAALVAGCSGGSSPQADADSTTTTAAADPGDTWTVVQLGEGLQAPLVDGKVDTSKTQPVSAANAEAARGAQSAVREYVSAAWVVPVSTGRSEPSGIASWVNLLGPGADVNYWGKGPVDQGPVTDKGSYANWRGDLRALLWQGKPGAPSDQQWATGVKYDYYVAKTYDGVSAPKTGGVLVQRGGDGALKAVYVQWAFEVGYSVTAPAEDAGAWQAAVGGGAKCVPVGPGSDAKLKVVDPAVRAYPAAAETGDTAPALIKVKAEPQYNKDNPRWLK